MTSLKRKFDSIDRVSKIRRISHRITKKLERSYKINKNSKRSDKEAIWQEKKEFTRIASRKQYMVGD